MGTEKKTSKWKNVIGATIAAVGLTFGVYHGGGQEHTFTQGQYAPQKKTNYVSGPSKHDDLIIHLKDGKTLNDVDALRTGGKYAHLMAKTKRFFGMKPTLGTTFDDTYRIDPSKGKTLATDAQLSAIEKALLADKEWDVVAVDRTAPQKWLLKGEDKPIYTAKTKECYSKDELCDKMANMDFHGGKEAHELLSKLKPKKVVTVAVLDTGTNAHVDLKDRLDKASADGHGHGTHVAGTVGAVSNNKKGVFSLFPNTGYIRIESWKVLDDRGYGSNADIAKATEAATNAGVKVINFSLGGRPTRVLAKAVTYALGKGVIVVAAAGNEGKDARSSSPACIEGVIAVGAVDNGGKGSWFSNHGKIVKISAVGGTNKGQNAGGVWSTVGTNDYKAFMGTSMAAPFVAGLAGGGAALHPDLTPKQFETCATAKENSKEVIPHRRGREQGRIPIAAKTLECIAKLAKAK